MSLFYHTPALEPPEGMCILGKTLPELYSSMQTMIISANYLALQSLPIVCMRLQVNGNL